MKNINWLRKRRQELRLNQEELAARLQVAGFDVTRSSISHWEVGRYNPPLDDTRFRAALAAALRMSVTDLLRDAGYEVSEDEQSPEAKRAAEIVQRLPPQARELAMDYLLMLDKKYASTA